MDPTQTLAELLEALAEERVDDAVERLDSLKEWLQNKGFLPDIEEALRRAGFYTDEPS